MSLLQNPSQQPLCNIQFLYTSYYSPLAQLLHFRDYYIICYCKAINQRVVSHHRHHYLFVILTLRKFRGSRTLLHSSRAIENGNALNPALDESINNKLSCT